MSTDQVSDTTVEVKAKPKGKMFKVEVTKGKGTIEMYTSELPDEVYAEVIRQGLKVLLNRGMTKITKETYPNADELKAAAMAKAALTFEDMKAGKIRIVGGKDSKVSGAVKTEAMRIARALVKDELKRQKIKISYVDAKDITEAANNILRANPDILVKAQEAVAAREVEAVKLKEGLAQIVTPGMVNSAKKAKVDKAVAEEKAKAKEALSATQAGMTAQRPAKGQQAKPQLNS